MVFAMPLMCCTLTCLGMVAASKSCVFHCLLPVLPVKVFRRGLWSDCTNKSEFHMYNEHLLIDMKIPKHSLVIAGHLHWLSMRLPEIYATGCTKLELSLRYWVCDSTLGRGSLSVSRCMSVSFDSSFNPCVRIPE